HQLLAQPTKPAPAPPSPRPAKPPPSLSPPRCPRRCSARSSLRVLFPRRLLAAGVMVEEKRERAEEASESPQKSPRLDPLAAAGPGCSGVSASPTGWSEWPSSEEAEAATSSDSTVNSMDDSGRCDHILFDLDMVVRDLKVANKVLKEPRKCRRRSCKTTWKGASEDDQGMMKCIDCAYFFCSGWPVDIENPQGHARWHAGEHQHWVAQWCDEPNLGYCFLCARPMRLSDWSEDDYAVAARNEKDQQMPGDSIAKDGWGTMASVAKEGCETGSAENPQKPPPMDLLLLASAAENTQKYPHLDLPVSKAPVLLSESPSTGEAEETSDCTYDIGSCEHLFKDREELDDMVRDIKTAEKPPECEHFPCMTTCTWRGAAAGLMVCTECTSTFCTGENGDMENPQGHARWHATRDYHWVALWYNEPYKGYCFECGHVLKLGQDKLSNDEWATVARNKRDERAMSASNGWDEWGNVAESYTKDLWAIVTGDDASGYANGNGCVIRGLPNLGNTCYMNALLQCLLALGELRTTILGLGARLGRIGLHLKQLFVETSSTNDARRPLDPEMLLKDMRVFNPQFKGSLMQDSQEFLTSLRSALEEETKELNKLHGGAEFHTIGNSIFRGWLRQTLYCISCPTKSVLDLQFDELQLALPSKDCPARSVTLPPMTRSRGSPTKTRKELFEQTDKTDGEKIHTISEGGDSQFPGSEFGDKAMEKTPKPLKVDSTEVEDVAHGRLQTQKNNVPREIIEVPIKVLDFIPNLFDDTERMDESIVDPHSPEGTGPPPLVDIEAEENTYSVELTTEDKGRAQSSDITDDEAVHMNSAASLEECLTLLCYCPMGWKCDNCSKVVELPRTNGSENGEPMIASTNVNRAVEGDQTELSDGKTCPSERSNDLNSLSVHCTSPNRQTHGSDAHHQVILSEDRISEEITSGMSYDEKNSASCSTTNKKSKSHEVVQEATPSSFPTDKQTDLLSAQDSQDTSDQNQGSGKQVKLDDHSAQQVEENRIEQKHETGGFQIQLIAKLPPVLTIQLKRFTNALSKERGHVSFKEILDAGPFMDPSSQDKGNSSYRLVGVIEHRGHALSIGHYVAYVRAGRKQQSSGSSSWVCASDRDIKEVPLEEVLGCEAYMLFYERMDDRGICGSLPTN
ncbi:ubiquitin carboxyl-terminal hydrolase 16-like, partial [Triticum urartu]|uniref:ubiquitin carboxyl-terminal hydrolase 16-like n=1 Tax=Triticum urartu TaxID=4572 RepID=UPI002042F2B4